MPIIPSLDQSSAYPANPDLATANPERFGKDAAALASLGGEIGDFGSKLMTARKRAMENDAVSQAHFDDVKWLTDTSNQMRLSYNKKDENGNPVINPDGSIAYDVDGFSKDMETKMTERRHTQMSKMPTGDAQRGYIDATNSMYGRAYQESMAWENITKADTYKKNFQIRNNSAANFLINNPDLNAANDSIDELSKSLSGSVGNVNTPGEAQELYHEGARVRIQALFVGYANNADTAKEGLAVLNNITEFAPKDYKTGALLSGAGETNYPDAGKEISKTTDANGKTTTVISAGGAKHGVFGSNLDPRLVQQSLTAPEIRVIRDRLESVIQEGDKANIADARSWLRDQKSLLMSTNPADLNRYSTAEQNQYLGFLAKRAADNPKDPMAKREAVEAGTMIAMGRASAIVRNELPMMAPSQKAVFDKRMEQEYDTVLQQLGAKTGSVAIGDKQEFQHLNERVWNNLMQERIKDPVNYVESFGGQPQGSIQGGMPDESRVRWRLSQVERLEMGSGMFTKNEVTGLVNQFKNDASTNPQRAFQNMEQMKQQMGSFSGAAVKELTKRGSLPSYFQEAYFQDNPDAAMSIIKNREPLMKDALEKSVHTSVDKKKLDESVGAAFAATGKAFQQSGGAKPTYFMQQSVRLEAIDIHNRDGVDFKEATKQAMDKLVNSQYHIMGSAFMPKQIGTVQTNPDYIKGEMQAIYRPDVQAKLGIDPPKSVDGKASREESISLGRWTTNPDNMGMTFMVPVAGKWTAVRSKDGTPVTIDFVRSSVNPSDEAVNYNRHFWESDIKTNHRNVGSKGAVVNSAPGDNEVDPEAQADSASKLQIRASDMDAMKKIKEMEAARKRKK